MHQVSTPLPVSVPGLQHSIEVSLSSSMTSGQVHCGCAADAMKPQPLILGAQTAK